MCNLVTRALAVAAALLVLLGAGPAGADPGAALPPLGGPPFVRLPLAGHGDAVVSVPTGSTTPRPVVIAAHGNYDRPEWQCQVWRGIVGTRAFVLCPRGRRRPDSPSPEDVRFTYASNAHLERELAAALEALRARFGARVDPGPLLYTGFSLGAIMAIPIVTRTPDVPARYPRLVLTEGGHGWSQAALRRFATGGGRRILFACGRPGCVKTATRLEARLRRLGVATRVVHGRGVGHSYDGRVAEAIKQALPWLLEGDPRFR